MLNRVKSQRLIIIVAVIVSVLALAFAAVAKRPAKYVGSDQCVSCHTDTHPALVKAQAKTAHRAAMVDVAKKPDAIVAKFDDDSPIKKSDIKYVLGLGKTYQNYLDKDLKVLPARWDTKNQKWVPQEAVDGATQCVGCHTTNFDPDTKTWTELGVGCESCHGPGAAHADSMEPKDINSLRNLDAKKQNMVCGQCHSTGTDPSGKYAFSVTYIPGDDLDKHFTLKAPTGSVLNTEYNDFITSKHAEGGMKCTTCHDTHGDKAKAEHQLRQPINDQCLGCHSATIESLAKHAPKAAADATCASCHMEHNSHKFQKGS